MISGTGIVTSHFSLLLIYHYSHMFIHSLYIVTGSPRNLNMADLSKLTYLEWCIKESMRLYPPVPFIARAVADDIELGIYNL